MSASRARLRAEQYAKYAPAGASVKVTEESVGEDLTISQAVVQGYSETICVTVLSRDGAPRCRVSAARWRTWSASQQKIKVRDIAWNIRNLYVHSTPTEAPR